MQLAWPTLTQTWKCRSIVSRVVSNRNREEPDR